MKARKQRRSIWLGVTLVTLTCLLWNAANAGAIDKDKQAAKPVAEPAAAPPQTPSDAQPQQFLRIHENEKKTVIGLQIALREYHRADGRRVGLVAVAHIAEESFYEEMEKALEGYDVVLFESVSPPGTRRVQSDDDAVRGGWTRRALEFLGTLSVAYFSTNERYPADLPTLRAFAVDLDARTGSWVDAAMTDAWDRPVQLVSMNEPAAFELTSLGADGKAGGEGAAADISIRASDIAPNSAAALSGEDNLQAELADAIDLAFQLDAIDYGQPNWRCSDMSIDQVQAAFTARGLDFAVIGDTLAGSSLPAVLIKGMLRLVRTLDGFMEGRIADTFKVLLIEMLGDEKLMESSFDQLGPGMEEVLIDDRNQVVIDDLKRILDGEPNVKSVAILYGAGHMPDMVERLGEQLGYRPEAEDKARWFSAITVDLNKSAVSKRELVQMRVMFRQMMRQK